MNFVQEIGGSAFTTVRQRVARHLLDLAAQESRTTRGTQAVLTVRVTQQQLAEAVGTVREVVVRVLRDLRESDVIRTHAGRIDIVDPLRLSQEQGGTLVPAGLHARSPHSRV